MEGQSRSSRLNPDSPLFIPSSFQHNPYYFLFPAPPIIPTPTYQPPPPPPSFPAYPPLLYHYYDTYYSLNPPYTVNTHLHINIPVPTPADQLLQEQPPSKSTPALPHDSLTDSVRQAQTPVTSGPKSRPKEVGPRGRNKDLVIVKSEKRQINDKKLRPKGVGWSKELIIHAENSKAAPKFIVKNAGERKIGGGCKFVRATKKTDDKEDVIPLREDEEKTTIMIKNIPNEYTGEMLLQLLDQHCNKENVRTKELILAGKEMISAYDFVYLPIDFWTRCNKGYAFVNFTNPEAVRKFYEAFNETSWDLFKSKKIIDIVSAKIQGKEGLVSHFGRSTFYCETDEYLPLWLDPPSDGSGQPLNLCTVGKRDSPMSRQISGSFNKKQESGRLWRFS